MFHCAPQWNQRLPTINSTKHQSSLARTDAHKPSQTNEIHSKQSLCKHGNKPHPHNLSRIRKASKKIRQRRPRYGSEEHTSTDCDNRHHNNNALITQERTSHGDKKCAQERAHREHLHSQHQHAKSNVRLQEILKKNIKKHPPRVFRHTDTCKQMATSFQASMFAFHVHRRQNSEPDA